MAVTTEAEILTETHRRAQLALRAAIVAPLIRSWPTFDPGDVAGSWARLEPLLLALIAAGGNTSAGLSAAYYTEFRAAEAIAGVSAPVLAAAAPAADVVRSLRYVGVVGAQKLVDARARDVAQVVFTNVSGEVSRQVLNQGRDTLLSSVAADPKALGWSRVTDSKPCSFCRMLASRGPVYRSKGGGFKAHGHCGCTIEPVYSHDQPWPGRAQEFHDEWYEVTAGRSGAEARLAYRQHVEGRIPA